MTITRMISALALCLGATAGAAAASDTHVTCVQQQLARLGLDPGEADGVTGVQTRRAVAEFVQRLEGEEAHAVFNALPEFSERAAVGWCREIGSYAPQAAEVMPSAEPPLILTKDNISPVIRGYIERSYEEARQTFAVEYGITTASKPVLIVAFGRDDLEDLLRLPVPGIDDLSPSAAEETADDLCVGVERVMGSAYRNRIALCMPSGDQDAVTSYEIWQGRYQYVMLHEYMHHVQREMSYDKVPFDGFGRRRMGPSWMVEGSAYLAQIKSREGPTRTVSVPMLVSLQSRDAEDPIPLDFIRKKQSVRSDAEYSASNLAAALLALRFGEDRMVVFWRAVGEEDDWDAAFEAAYDMRMDDFEDLFEDMRHDLTKLVKFARAEAPYGADMLRGSSSGPSRSGHGARVRLRG
ncbi:peptidoglycan-binding domain-containing protein [Antarctobacter sp.]|uniref:peptidoglycan-binding domain-containing protein n=1 Tax=Antarctobacter sp. TaxID=1872577 RepID=UPI002B27C0D3|nr:peptidoglycan-binding domain-containing protein [Antarctobacter sp.]